MKTSGRLCVVTGCLLATLAVAPAQTPPTAGLKLWLKADAIAGLNSGDPVSTWPDSSGYGYHATQSTPANQPHYVTNILNGLPAVWFADPLGQSPVGDSTAIDHLTSPLPLNPNSNSVTAIIVFRSDITGQRDHVIQPLGDGTTWLYVETNASSTIPNNCGLWSVASQRTLGAAVPYFRGTWTIAAVVQDATAKTLALYRDGVLEGASDIGTLATPASAGWQLGANKPRNGHALNGYIAEVLIYEGALDEATRRAAEEYLAEKYALPLRKNLLTDTFNTADTYDLDANLAARQTGALAPISNQPAYSTVLQNAGAPDYAQITNRMLALHRLNSTTWGKVIATPNLNFRAHEVNGSFRVTLDVNITSAAGDAWSAIAVSASPLNAPISTDGFALLVRPGGTWQAFDGNASIGAGTVSGDPNYRVCIEVAVNKVRVFLNGLPLAFSGGVYEWTLAAPGAVNYVTLSQFSAAGVVPAIGRFDNLAVSVLPESPTVILADNFNTANTADLNSNLAARQTGTVAPVSYITTSAGGASIAIENNQAEITNPANAASIGIFWPGLDFQPYEYFSSFRIRFKVSPTAVGGPDSWAAVKFREPNPTVGVAGGVGPGILIRPGGGWQAFLGNTPVGNGAVPTASTYEFDIEVRTNTAKVTINGYTIGALPIPAPTPPYYVALMSFASAGAGQSAAATFDDFEFSALGRFLSAAADVVSRPWNLSMKIRKDALLANDSSGVSLVSVGSPTANGVSLAEDATYIFYPAGAPNLTDRFRYTITNSTRGAASAWVTVYAQKPAPGQVLSVTPAGGSATVRFAGIPGYSYAVERATDVTFTAGLKTWYTNAPSNGLFEILDNFSDLGGPPAQAFYRLRYNP